MNATDAKRLQLHLAQPQDGIIGRGTLTAAFKFCGCEPVRAAELALAGLVHMTDAGVLDTSQRFAHFMAQVGHESGGFRYMEEIASGSAYEGRIDLGNTVAGDGRLFKGRGPLQITGRANYRFYGRLLGIDLESHPELAAVPSIGMMTACAYWTQRGLNDFADRDDVEGLTRRVNGGLNGLDDRKARLARMKGLFA